MPVASATAEPPLEPPLILDRACIRAPEPTE
jgi:hypothetical protein